LGKDAGEAHLGRIAGISRLIDVGNGDIQVAVIGAAPDDRPGPVGYECIDDAFNVRLDPRAFAVEQHEWPESGIFELRCIDVHLLQYSEKCILDVESGQRLVGQRLEPTSHRVKKVIV